MDLLLDPWIAAIGAACALSGFLSVFYVRTAIVPSDAMSRIKFVVSVVPVTIMMLRFSAAVFVDAVGIPF